MPQEAELRQGEVIVESAGGTCAVCKKLIPKGKAVQLSRYTSRIRHLECIPKSDKRILFKGKKPIKRLAE